MRTLDKLTVLAGLVVCAAIICLGCTPKPKPPEPNYPSITDASPPLDASPVDCSTFAGKWKVVDIVMTVEGDCHPPDTNDLLTLSAVPMPEDQANEGWRAVVTTNMGMVMMGPASQLEDRPYVCRFVVEASDASRGTVFNRDFILGEVGGHGRGEATGRNGDCVWKATSSLELF